MRTMILASLAAFAGLVSSFAQPAMRGGYRSSAAADLELVRRTTKDATKIHGPTNFVPAPYVGSPLFPHFRFQCMAYMCCNEVNAKDGVQAGACDACYDWGLCDLKDPSKPLDLNDPNLLPPFYDCHPVAAMVEGCIFTDGSDDGTSTT